MAKAPKFQTSYDFWEAPEFDNTKDEKVTVESMADDADINVIMKRFGLTGVMPDVQRLPEYGDFTGIQDYRTALHAVRHADEIFMEYPAELRAKFENNPNTFMEWIHNPANLEEARSLGFAKPLPEANTPPPATPLAAPPQGGAKGGGTSST